MEGADELERQAFRGLQQVVENIDEDTVRVSQRPKAPCSNPEDL